MHAKCGVFVHALRVLGRGRRPDAPGNAAKRRCFEVCKTSKLHSTRSVLPRQGQTFCLSGSSRKGDGFILFASAKRTKKQPGLRPATSVQIAGRNSVFTEMTGVHQVTGFVQTAILHSIDGNDLNRYELQA